MKKTLRLIIIPLLLAGADPGMPGKDTGDELWLHLQRRSAAWFSAHVKQKGRIDPGDWRAPLEAAFLKLVRTTGHDILNYEYAVVNDPDFNAFCLPGGHFIINSGMLNLLGERAARLMERDGERGKKLGASWYREREIAPVIAHELGHYVNRHGYQSIRRYWSLKKEKSGSADIKMLQYTRENELEADRTAFMLLRRGGYDPELLIGTLLFINGMQQRYLAASKDKSAFNLYLDTHPSPHQRLASLKHDLQDLHAWAASMEQVFSEIQLGRNIGKVLPALESALLRHPGNLHLKKARAVAMHKRWLATVPLKDQQLRGILDMPSFRDDMVFRSPPRGRRDRKKIPGKKKFFLEAKRAYEEAHPLALDPSFSANFALLLCFSPENADAGLARKLIEQAVKDEKTVANFNNYAVVLYVTGERERALTMLSGLARQIDSGYSEFLGSAERGSGEMHMLRQLRDDLRRRQLLSREYVRNDFTPLLNCALALVYGRKGKNAKVLAKDYLARYESTSSWARYMAQQAGVQVPDEKARSYLPVGDIRIEDTLDDVLRKWQAPSLKLTGPAGKEHWIYGKLNARLTVENGQVIGIYVDSPLSPPVNGKFRVGSTRRTVEGVLGKHRRVSNGWHIYIGGQNMAVQYIQDRAAAIELFP